MSDFLYRLKVKLTDLGDSVRTLIPYEVYEQLPVIVPGIILIVSLAAVLICAKAGSNAGSIEDSVKKFQDGQEQLESVLGERESIGLVDEAVDVMGRTDLILQYKELAALDGESDFRSMEKMANVSEGAEEKAAKNVDKSYYDSIGSFAGNYGGALIRNPFEAGRDIRLAAYDGELMDAPAGDNISNIMVKQIKRTIPSGEYGVIDKKDILTILSGNDINGFSSIKKGSVMYLLLGRSTGSKSSSKYVCTGVVPGSLEDNSTLPDSQKDETTDAVEEGMDEDSGYFPEASISVGPDDEVSVSSDGTVTYGDGTQVKKDGTVIYSDGTVVSPEGIVTYPDGMVIKPDGTITGGKTVKQGSPENNGEKSSGIKNEKIKNGEKSSNNEKLADAGLPTVYGPDGIPVEEDKKNTVVLYSVNSKSGSVTITYWNTEDNGPEDTNETDMDTERN